MSLEMREMSKTYRVKTEYVSLIQKTHIDFILKTRLPNSSIVLNTEKIGINHKTCIFPQ